VAGAWGVEVSAGPLVLDGSERVAFDAVHHVALKQAAPWPLAEGVVREMGGECDLVLVAVPAGRGAGFARYLHERLTSSRGEVE
jgi:hypothetical protein